MTTGVLSYTLLIFKPEMEFIIFGGQSESMLTLQCICTGCKHMYSVGGYKHCTGGLKMQDLKMRDYRNM